MGSDISPLVRARPIPFFVLGTALPFPVLERAALTTEPVFTRQE